MDNTSLKRFLNSCADNRKSKTCGERSRTIQNRKLMGIVALVITLAMCWAVAEAQQSKKVPRIGLLAGGRGLGVAGDAFRQALRELGWVENRTIAIETQLAEVNLDKLPQLAADLVRLKVAVIVADGDLAIQAARQATSTIPIVLIAVGDPVTEGFVASLARPGRNLTGLTSISADLSGKRLELVKEIFSKASRVNVLWNPANSSNVLEFKAMEAAARALGLKLQSLEVRVRQDFRSAFAAAARDRSSALIVLRDPLIDSEHFQILDFAIDKRLPLIHGESQFVEAGGLMSYGPSRIELFRRAANYVDKILKGAKPAELPVEQPTKFELIINLKTVKQIGMTIPPNVLVRADRVIK
jgi:putative tryptophan/tyrosine transport system substrate-binding protein